MGAIKMSEGNVRRKADEQFFFVSLRSKNWEQTLKDLSTVSSEVICPCLIENIRTRRKKKGSTASAYVKRKKLVFMGYAAVKWFPDCVPFVRSMKGISTV